MSRAIAVLRPEPGNRITAAAIEAEGRPAIRLPLFSVASVVWNTPDPAEFDALILTSANAVRHGGTGLAALQALPVYAVGESTAHAARCAGFDVVEIGAKGADTLVAAAAAAGVTRGLHLGGRERTLAAGGIVARAITVYASETLDIAADDASQLTGTVALVQSTRAARRLAALVNSAGLDRATIALAIVSAKAAAAAGSGWERIVVPDAPSSAALIAAAFALAD